MQEFTIPGLAGAERQEVSLPSPQNPTHCRQNPWLRNARQRIAQAQRIAQLGCHLTGLVASALALGSMIAERRSSRLQKLPESYSHDEKEWFRDLVARANLVRNPAWSKWLQEELRESSQHYDIGRSVAEAGRAVSRGRRV